MVIEILLFAKAPSFLLVASSKQAKRKRAPKKKENAIGIIHL
jgi:hypothetical protein